MEDELPSKDREAWEWMAQKIANLDEEAAIAFIRTEWGDYAADLAQTRHEIQIILFGSREIVIDGHLGNFAQAYVHRFENEYFARRVGHARNIAGQGFGGNSEQKPD